MKKRTICISIIVMFLGFCAGYYLSDVFTNKTDADISTNYSAIIDNTDIKMPDIESSYNEDIRSKSQMAVSKYVGSELEFKGAYYDIAEDKKQFFYWFEDKIYKYGVIENDTFVTKIELRDDIDPYDKNKYNIDDTMTLAKSFIESKGDLKRVDTGSIITYFEQIDGFDTGSKAVFVMSSDKKMYGAYFFRASDETAKKIKDAKKKMDREVVYNIALDAILENYKSNNISREDITSMKDAEIETKNDFNNVIYHVALKNKQAKYEIIYFVKINADDLGVIEVTSSV